ncbi:cytosolic sulfotransferase 12-like [Aristolochia californica]|uniref:cytosolic sulfotransferase 12-like n=1 Tax=Aristolochia californica TaxID=171875 RepID=UPI0035E052AF
MASSTPVSDVKYLAEEDNPSHDYKALISSLPTGRGWPSPPLYQYQGFWHLPAILQGTLSCQKEFKTQENDLLAATFVKSGTTWLKALAFSVVNRKRYAISQHPLLTTSPADLVPHVELAQSAVMNLSPPRLLATHLPFTSLPSAVKDSPGCKIVYLCRNPRDTFVSLWLFSNKVAAKSEPPLAVEEALELFCEGVCPYGPYWDHVLGYWRQSQETPERVLFLNYENMKADCGSNLKKLAGFLGCPFSVEEEEGGVVEEITKLCSFSSLSNLEVNRKGATKLGTETSAFFRRGEVGDWRNFLTDQMVEKIDRITEQKLHGSGLTF